MYNSSKKILHAPNVLLYQVTVFFYLCDLLKAVAIANMLTKFMMYLATSQYMVKSVLSKCLQNQQNFKS